MTATAHEMTGSGTVRKLSVADCQLETEGSCTVNKSSMVEMRIHVPALGWSIIIDEAVVQWIRGKQIGLSFMTVRVREGDRLAWVMRRSEQDMNY
jgi:hypothetical protein